MSTWTDIPATAAKLCLSYNQVARLVLRGEIEGTRINGRWRILSESVEQYAERQNGKGARGATA